MDAACQVTFPKRHGFHGRVVIGIQYKQSGLDTAILYAIFKELWPLLDHHNKWPLMWTFDVFFCAVEQTVEFPVTRYTLSIMWSHKYNKKISIGLLPMSLLLGTLWEACLLTRYAIVEWYRQKDAHISYSISKINKKTLNVGGSVIECHFDFYVTLWKQLYVILCYLVQLSRSRCIVIP